MIKFSKNKNQITVKQCLFGYMDGHRLLASSDPLDDEASSILLLMSDLAAGVNLSANEGYWTGLSLPTEKSYALMYTWSAPEMPRPGCVWSHAIVIPFSDIASFNNLSILIKYFIKPISVNELENFNTRITVFLDDFTSLEPFPNIDEKKALQVVRAIYSTNRTGEVVGPLGMFDNEIFAVWSQQWPRLRRSFSFRTAANLNDNSNLKNRFELLVPLNSELLPVDDFFEPWEKVCVDNLVSKSDEGFKKFLWRYGSDIRNGITKLKFLTNLYIDTRYNIDEGKNLENVFKDIVNSLPSLDNGKVLKEDLIIGNQYSLMPALNFIDVIHFYLTEPVGLSSLPVISEEKFQLLDECWDSRLEDILSLGEIAASYGSDFGDNFLCYLMNKVSPDDFLLFTATRPNLRNNLLTAKPSLLDSAALADFSADDIQAFIEYISDKDLDLIQSVLRRLIVVDDSYVTKTLMQKFPDSTFAFIISAIENFLDAGGVPVAWSWMNLVVEKPINILYGGYIERARSTSSLSFFASVLSGKMAFQEVVHVGAHPWAKGLDNARNNLNKIEQQKFYIFLLRLALANPGAGSEALFELTFEYINEDIKYSNMNWQQIYELQEYLPNLGWYSNWDNCLRLKIGVVNSYVENNLNYDSFKRLTGDEGLQFELTKLLESSKEGRKYLKAYRN